MNVHVLRHWTTVNCYQLTYYQLITQSWQMQHAFRVNV